MKARLSKIAALIVTATVTFGGAAPVNAWATYQDNAPTIEAAVDSNIVKATAHRSASPLPEMLGANTPSGYGMINGGAQTAENAMGNFALEIWGSINNVSPDPYWWNYYYNFNGGNSSNALINIDAQGSPTMADTLLFPEYGNISVSLYRRPDVAIGVSSNNDPTDTHGYDSQIATIRSFTPTSPFYVPGDETYDPELVPYYMGNLDTMIDIMYDTAEAIVATGKPARYGNPIHIAEDYENYIKGIKGYIKHEIGSANFKTIAIVSAVNSDGTYVVVGQGASSQTSTNRYVEYTNDVTNNLTRSASATATSAQLAGVDAIVITSDVAETAIKADTTITGAASAPELISANEVETLYGISMNSLENALGMGYILARIYDDSASVLNVKYVYEYFASKFYHIRASRLDSIYNRAIVGNINPSDDEYADLHVTDNAYNEAALEVLFATYSAYFD